MTKATDWNTGKETDWPMPEEGKEDKAKEYNPAYEPPAGFVHPLPKKSNGNFEPLY